MSGEAFDDANRASLGPNWTLGLFSIVISASTVFKGNSAGNDNSMWWNANNFPSDQYAQVVIKTDVDGGGPVVRHQSGANTYYVCISSGTFVEIFEVTAGSFATLGGSSAVDTVVNDIIKLDVTGSTLTAFLNGTSIHTRSDASITGGAPGIGIFSTNFTCDDWRAGPVISRQAPVSRSEAVNRAAVY